MTRNRNNYGWLESYFTTALGVKGNPFLILRQIILEEYYSLTLQVTERKWPAYLRHPAIKLLQRKQLTFFSALFSLLAKLAESDGPVSKSEISAVEDFMEKELKLSPKQKILALQIFREARTAPNSFEEYATHYFKLFRKNRSMLENMIDALLSIALADRRIHFDEERLIFAALKIFQLSRKDYDRIKHRHEWRSALYQKREALKVGRHARQSEQDKQRIDRQNQRSSRRMHSSIQTPLEQESGLARACKILGVTTHASPEIIKKAYRKLVLTHHPDRLAAQGLPEEFRAMAANRFREIQEAFEFIQQQRNFV